MATLVPDILGADPMAAALLIECRGRDADALQASIDEVRGGGGGG
jgi:D-lactate dehydrogenase